MNAEKRSEILEEGGSKSRSISFIMLDILGHKLSMISEETKQKIQNVKSFIKGQEQEMGGDDLMLLFKGDKQKIERYKTFLWEKQGKLVSGIPPGNMSFEQLKKEKEEFE
jgi:hypothetical protein